jgi:hypothetical protein
MRPFRSRVRPVLAPPQPCAGTAMTTALEGPGRHLHPWRERLTLGNLILLGLLGLCCALATWELVERRVVAPACRAHAVAHGLSYRGIDVHGSRQDQPGPHCLFTRADGSATAVWLQRAAPFLTDLWVNVAMDLELAVPLWTVLLALLWVKLAPPPAARAGVAGRGVVADAAGASRVSRQTPT